MENKMKIFDLHADIGTHILEEKKRSGIDNVFMQMHYDKLVAGGIGCTSIACYFTGSEDWQYMKEMVLAAEEEITKSPVHWIKTKEDLIETDQLSVILTVEGMCGIDQDPEERIEWLYKHGVRIASLCHNDQNALASGQRGSSLNGLTELGKRAIKKMNELNMIIDVSHANEKTFWDILNYSTKPVIATHSNLRTLCCVDRNLTDQQYKALSENGGLCGLVSAVYGISLVPENQNVLQLAKHAVKMKELASVENIGVGFDYMDFLEEEDGNDTGVGLSNARDSQNLVKALRQFFTEQETEKIVWSNSVNFLKKWL